MGLSGEKADFEWRVNSKTGEKEKIGNKGGETEQYIYWDNDKNYSDVLKGSSIFTGEVAKDRYTEGEFSYGVSTLDLWKDVPDEYRGSYNAYNLAERYKANAKGGAKIGSIKAQEKAGLSRLEMVWNRRDYTLYLENKYGSSSVFIMAHDTGMLPLPGGPGRGMTNVHSRLRRMVPGTQFSPNFKPHAPARMSWNQFQKANKGKFSGAGHRRAASEAYKEYKAMF